MACAQLSRSQHMLLATLQGSAIKSAFTKCIANEIAWSPNVRRSYFTTHGALPASTTIVHHLRASRPWSGRFCIAQLGARRAQNLSTATVNTSTPNSPKPARRLRRFFFYFVYANVAVLVGFYAGISLYPDKKALLKALLDRRVTDAESLELLSPQDEETKAVNDIIVNHPLAQHLRQNPDFVESRPHLKLPDAIRQTNLTGGTLSGPGLIVAPPLQFVEKHGKEIVSIFYLGKNLCGHPGIIHGGLLATLLDEGLARCCFPALPNGIGVTAHLDINYLKPVFADNFYVLRAETTKVDGRKAWVTGWIETLPVDSAGAPESQSSQTVSSSPQPATSPIRTPVRHVEAKALFVEPKNVQVSIFGKLFASILRIYL